MGTIKQVALVGGTHGNELTGIALLRHWREHPDEIARSSFAVETHLANPKANQANRRYLDQDLNRQFHIDDLGDFTLTGYEHNRAKALNSLLGPKEDPRVDFVIDMHTTTANMGMSLIFNTDDPLVVGMAFYVQQQMPHATLFFDNMPSRLEDNFLTSLGRYNGFLIEVGPVPQGLLRADIYLETQQAAKHCLDYLELYNKGEVPELPKVRQGYQFVEKVKLPKNEAGDLTAMVHPNLQDKDYEPISKGDPFFLTTSGETIAYDRDETLYGAFINEAAYYDVSVGLSLMRKIDIELKSEPAAG
ncbi:aspartoacylase [Reinekea marinisedimentorum]|uniref:Aspartoacylase n=1 Tax=Reinekea marinisedimentorum TaxID=230495 RepID=A0A4R3IDS1_9GAMM|nr:aspartoacylase [Reinekea marinisedimentorum]TCS44014.1 aspartoacylase [Reinekea marinisedimentorum]